MGLDPILPSRNYSSIPKVNLRARDDIFVQNDNSENEDDISFDDYHRDTSSIYSDDFEENGNENDTSSHMFFTPPLEDLKNFLYVALNPYFDEFKIAIVSCPCLTKAPYNLAAAGLSGNTGILKLGTFDYFHPSPQTDLVFDIRFILSRCNNDVFVIGSGFAAQPSMPCNGYLTMNAVVSANPTNVINNSCIAYKNTDQLELQIINDHNLIRCCIFGQFFFSEGKRGPVIKIRAKGRRSKSSIIMLMQAALTKLCQYQPLIGLGMIFLLNGGQTDQRFLSNNFVSYDYNDFLDYYRRLNSFSLNCINLIAMGAIISEQIMTFDDYEYLKYCCSMFNTFTNYESFGNFFNDLTPEETEYIVYINIAQETCS